MLKIIVNQHEIDLGSLKGITLYISPGLLDNDITEGSYSVPFDIPASDVNNDIFGFPYRVGNSNKQVIKLPAELWHSGIKLKEGTLEASKFGKNSISCNLFIDNGGIYSDFNEKKLSENDFGGEKDFVFKDEYDPDDDDCLLFAVKNPNYYKDNPAYDESNNYGMFQNYYNQISKFNIPIDKPSIITPFPVLYKLLEELFVNKGYLYQDTFFNSADLKKLTVYNTVNAVKTEVYASGGFEYLRNVISKYNIADHVPTITTGAFIHALQKFFNIKFYVRNLNITIVDRLEMIKASGYDDITSRAVGNYTKEETGYSSSDGVAISMGKDENDANINDIPDLPDNKIHFYTSDPVYGLTANAYDLAAIYNNGLYWWRYVNYRDFTDDLDHDYWIWMLFPNYKIGGTEGAKSYAAVKSYLTGNKDFKIENSLCAIPSHDLITEFYYPWGYFFPHAKYKGNSDRHSSETPFNLRLLIYNGLKSVEDQGTQPHATYNNGSFEITPKWSYTSRWQDYIDWYNKIAGEIYYQEFKFSVAEFKNFDFSRKKMINGNLYFIKDMKVQLTLSTILPVECSMFLANDFPAVPTINIDKNRLYFETVTTSGNSIAQSINITGIALKYDAIIRSNSDFYISTDGINWSQQIKLTQINGHVNNTILIRFSPTSEQDYYQNISINSIGAEEKIIGVSGTGYAADPLIQISQNSILFGAVQNGTVSQPTAIVITGTNLNGDVTIDAPTGFELSANGSNYSSQLVIPNTGGNVSTSFYVRFAPQAVQSYTGNVAISSPGATSLNIALTGTGIEQPSIVTSKSLINFGDIQLGQWANDSFTFSGSNLSGDVTIEGDTYCIPSADGITFSQNLTYTPSSGAIPTTTVYLRCIAGQPQPWSGAIKLRYGGVVMKTITVTMNGQLPQVIINSSHTSINFASVLINSNSDATLITLTNANVVSNVVIDAPTGFKISANGTDYVDQLTFTPPVGNAPINFYARFSPTQIQSYSGNISINTNGIATINIAVSGTGIDSSLITTSKSSINFGNVVMAQWGNDSFTFSGTGLSGDVTVEYDTFCAVSSDGVSFGLSITVTPTNGEIVNAPVYLRCIAGQLQPWTGSIRIKHLGVVMKTVSVSITGVF